MASSSDTRTRGFVPPQNEDERFLMRRVEELCRTAMQRGIPRATGFISDREQALAQAALNREGCDFARFQGGWPDAERKVLCIEPPDSWPEEPIAVLHFTAPQQGGSAVPGHRDYLGAILGLGLDRACLGDILPDPADARSVYAFVLEDKADFIASNLTEAGRSPVHVESCDAVPEEVLRGPERQTQDATVPSLRADTVLAAMMHTSRSIAAQAVHNYFQSRGYVYVHTPLITANDAEGAGNTFTVTNQEMGKPYKAENDFFGRATALAVTGQLEAETYALAYKRVYTFGPTFRAENSNTKTHAAEFWMIEPEICFCDLNGLMDIEEDFLKSVVQEVLDKAMPELEFLQGYAKSNLIEKLQTLTQSHVARVTHAEAIDILQHATHPFEHPAVQGEDLFKEHEKYLTEEHFKSPVFVYDWPKEIKAFYMYQNDDGKTVRGVDLLVPGSGELMGGSERETRLDLLTGRMDELHISKEQMDWYVNLRRFGGCTHSGFGMGFERLIMYLTDIENIRDVIPYPRTPGNCEF